MYERGKIYKTHKGYFMCLGVRRKGVLAVNLNCEQPVEMIKIRVRSFFADIESISYKYERWLHENGATCIDKASTYEYYTVANAINNFITGVIIRDIKTGILGYSEDIKELNDKIIEMEAEKKALQKVVEEFDKRGKDLDEQMSNLKQSMSEVDEGNIVEGSSIDEFIPDVEEGVESEPEKTIEQNPDPEQKLDDPDVETEIWYDLTTINKDKAVSKYTFTLKRSSPAPKSPKGNVRLFRESEVCDIAVMSPTAVALKYDVTRVQASNIIRNAKKIFEDLDPRVKSNSYVSLFEQGKTIDEVVEETGSRKNIVKAAYESWMNNKNATISRADAMKYWMDKANTMSIADLSNLVFDTKAINFAAQNNMTKQTASAIQARIKREILSRSPLVAAGFNQRAFDTEWLGELASGKYDNDSENRIRHRIYDNVMPLYMAYTKSFNDHVDILYGKKPIPDSVKPEQKDTYIMLLRRRLENITSIYADIRKKETNNTKHDDIAVKYMVTLSSVRRTMSKVK